jgi:hypothetical protein
LTGNLIVQLGVATEELNRRWYEANTGQVITDAEAEGVSLLSLKDERVRMHYRLKVQSCL